MGFNPSAPNTIGEEWFVRQELATALDAATRPAAFGLVSTATETIDKLFLPHQWTSGGSTGYGRLWSDTYVAGNELLGQTITELSFSPNETKTSSGITKSDFFTTSNLHQAVDDADDSGPPENTDYIVNSNTGVAGSYVGFQFNTAAIPNTWRIAYVKLEVRCKGFDWSWQAPKIDVEWYNGATRLGRIARLTPPQDYEFRTTTFGPFYYDFYNEGLWLQPEIALLDDNTKRNIRLTLSYACAVSRVTLKVGVATETRHTVGITPKITVAPTGVQTNTPFGLSTPLGVDNMAKVSGVSYTTVVRRLEDPFGAIATHIPGIVNLEGVAACPHNQGIEKVVTVADASGILSSVAAGTTKTYAPTWATAAPAASVDSQPYWDLDAKPIYVAAGANQAVSGASAQSYRRLRAMVAVGPTAPDVPLVFGVRKTSTADVTESFTGANGSAWSATWTAGSSVAGASSDIQSNAGRFVTGTTANAYARNRTTSPIAANSLITGKITFASIASTHYGLVYVRGSSTFATGQPGLQSSYDVAFVASGGSAGVVLYRVGPTGVEVGITSFAMTFVAGTQYSFKILTLTNGLIAVKCWATAGTEPSAWGLAATDTTYTGTYMALAAQNDGAGGTSRTVTFDDIAIYNMIATGDLTAADLADSAIATARGTGSFGTSFLGITTPLSIYDTVVTMDAGVTLAAATDYTIEAASSVAAANAWFLLWVDATASHVVTGNLTYGGATDAAAYGNGPTTPQADLIMTFGSIPTAPAGLAATVGSLTVPDNGDPICNPGALQYARVTWTASSLGASFRRYDVERLAAGSTSWEPVVTIAAEASSAVSDYEISRGIAYTYRVRVVRTDDAYSDWSTSSAVTCSASISGSVFFVSNADPTLACGFVVADPTQSYAFPSADETVFMKLHQTDYQKAFKPSEVRGAAWSFPVLVYQSDSTAPPTGRGIRAFDTIRAVGEASVPYVCVLTWNGERLFGAVQVPEGQQSEPEGMYLARVVVTQTQGEPAAIAL